MPEATGPEKVADDATPPVGVEAHSLPLVTVLVPCFNSARFLRQALDSIVSQSYTNLEIILLDDHSTDGSADIAADYAPAVRVIRQTRNLGQFGNVNAGLALARGEYVCIFHSDDEYLPTIIEEEVHFLRAHPEVGAVFTTDRFIDAEGREYGRMRLPREIPPGAPLDYPQVLNALLTHKNRIFVGPSAMVRAAIYRKVGAYDESRYGIAADLDMWVRISRISRVAVLGRPLMRYRHFHGNLSQQYNLLRTEPERYFRIMDERLASEDARHVTPAARRHFEAHRAEDRLMAAITHYIRGERREGREALHKASVRRIIASSRVQRTRLLLIAAGLGVLLSLPRSSGVAAWMHRRWHAKRSPFDRDGSRKSGRAAA